MESAYLRVQTFNELPSASEFASQIEPRNVPAVIISRYSLTFALEPFLNLQGKFTAKAYSCPSSVCFSLELVGFQGMRQRLGSFFPVESLQWRSRLLAGSSAALFHLLVALVVQPNCGK